MASSSFIPVRPDFDMEAAVSQLVQIYQSRGYQVMPVNHVSGYSIDFRKDDDGIKKYLGLSTGLRANLTLNNGNLRVDYVDEDWTIKIAVAAIGFFITLACIGLALMITGGIGIFNQFELSKKIGSDIQMLAMGAPASFGASPPYNPYNQQAEQNNYQEQPIDASQLNDCPNCGVALNPDSQFCTNCGAKQN